MTDPFRLEAQYYDKVFGEESNYKNQAQFLDKILKKHNVTRILDLACGTGGHCLELSKLGYEVVGIDISQSMIEKASKKHSKEGVRTTFLKVDMTKTHSALLKANIKLDFDAIICMDYSFAHLTNDKMVSETLEQVQKILRPEGVFIFCLRNAKKIREDLINQLRIDSNINEPNLQLALLSHTHRDPQDPDILVWNSLWLINNHGKMDFQVRTHPLRWFRYTSLKAVLETYGFIILQEHGDLLGHEQFDCDKHDTILLVCQRE